jgi:hypothetical protein
MEDGVAPKYDWEKSSERTQPHPLSEKREGGVGFVLITHIVRRKNSKFKKQK